MLRQSGPGWRDATRICYIAAPDIVQGSDPGLLQSGWKEIGVVSQIVCDLDLHS
jgi:hypothetical protein